MKNQADFEAGNVEVTCVNKHIFILNTMKETRVILLLWLFLMMIGVSKAQESIVNEIDYTKLEKLIELAKDYYPQRQILEISEQQAKTAIALSSLSYLNGISASYYYRERGRPVVNELNPYILNGFQIGVGVNLSSLITTPIQVRQARRNHKVAQLQSQEYDKVLENEVKAKYYNYIQLNNELKIRTQAVQDIKTLYGQVQSDFELGSVDFESYASARAAIAEASSAVIATEVSFMLAKDQLEALIGVSLEEVN